MMVFQFFVYPNTLLYNVSRLGTWVYMPLDILLCNPHRPVASLASS